MGLPAAGTASLPPESRRLRQFESLGWRHLPGRLTSPGIAATAAGKFYEYHVQQLSASLPPESRRLRRDGRVNIGIDIDPPHFPRNRGDCGSPGTVSVIAAPGRLTSPGIAATAAALPFPQQTLLIPPHFPRNRGDCGSCGPAPRSRSTTASLPPESRRLRPMNGHGDFPFYFRLTSPGIAATAAT